jgi:hypothetical protein
LPSTRGSTRTSTTFSTVEHCEDGV